MKVIIPEDLSEIKLKDYQKYLKIVEDNEGADDFLALKMIEVFCHIKFSQVRQLPMKDVEEIVTILNNTFESKRKFQRHFKIRGIEYGFIPDLENISMGEYIDITSYLGDTDSLHKLMAVLYRPTVIHKKELYTIKKYEGSSDYSDVMKEAPLDVCLESQVFFWDLTRELLKGTADYLEALNLTSQEKETLEASGVGINQFMELHKEGSLTLTE